MSLSAFDAFHPIAAIAATPQALQTLAAICPSIGATLYVPSDLADPERGMESYGTSLSSKIAELWDGHRALIFCLAAGATVRLIAPLLKDKNSDPAVMVIDPPGKYAICLSGSHQGGGDRLAQLLATLLSATPILTGASSQSELPAIDLLGVPYGWRKGWGDWTGLSAAIAQKQPIAITQTAGSTLWQQQLPDGHPFIFDPDTQNSGQAHLWITSQLPQIQKSPISHGYWHPRVLWVGIGCIRGTSEALIARAIAQTLEKSRLSSDAIAGIATLNLKADEVGLLNYCRAGNYLLRTFTAEQLKAIATPHPSSVVEQEVGTPSVAEAAALFAAQTDTLRVAKQIFKSEDGSEAVTVAIAQAEREYCGKTGKLALIGIGPGNLDQLTPAAKTALLAADVWIGYSLYLDLIQPLARPGLIREAFAITEERRRSQRAIELADWGLNVAVVSSGDCGIYGMAGLVLEMLRKQGWDGQTPAVEVYPGISALQAAASRVGAPLMHDFCAISLSDRLTPLAVIEKRLQAAAIGDFVAVIYNPRSQVRTEPFRLACQIFQQHRDPQTPVAIVRSAYRPDEQIQIATLDRLTESAIDMFTTLIIGNSNTCQHASWLITPRGYAIADSEAP
jgi:cobalt-precorrin 5A hydrolase/precorrin-3B C17-methyltransferase